MTSEGTFHVCYVHLSLRKRLKLLFGAGIRVTLEFEGAVPRSLPNVQLQVDVVPSQ